MHQVLTSNDPEALVARIRTELVELNSGLPLTGDSRPAEPSLYPRDAVGQLFETLHRDRTESSECAIRWANGSSTPARALLTAYEAGTDAQRQLLQGLQNALEQRAAAGPATEYPIAYALERQLVYQDLRAESAVFAVRALDRELAGGGAVSIPLNAAAATPEAGEAASLGMRWIALERQTLAHARAQAIKHFDDVVYAPGRTDEPGLSFGQRRHREEIEKQGFLSVALVAQQGLANRAIPDEPDTDLTKQAFVHAALWTHLVSEYLGGQVNPLSRYLHGANNDGVTRAIPLTDGDRYLGQCAENVDSVLKRLMSMQAVLCDAAHGLARDNKPGEVEPVPQATGAGQVLGRAYDERPLYGLAQFLHDAGGGWPPGRSAGWLGSFLVDLSILVQRALPAQLNPASHVAPPSNFGQFSDDLTRLAQSMDAPLRVFREPVPPPSASRYDPVAGEFFDLVKNFGSFGSYGATLAMPQFVSGLLSNDAMHLLSAPPSWMLQDAGPHSRPD